MTEVFIIYCVLSVVSAILSHGLTLAFFWHEFPTLQSEERWGEIWWRQLPLTFVAGLSPFVCVSSYWMTDCAKHGLMFRRPHP